MFIECNARILTLYEYYMMIVMTAYCGKNFCIHKCSVYIFNYPWYCDY